MLKDKIIKVAKHPRKVFIWIVRTFLCFMPDTSYLKIFYWVSTGKCLNLANPHTFNEKLQWLKLYDRRPEYIQMVDKYEAKEYVSKIIGKEYVIPTLGVWDRVEDIEFSLLPNQFVLKCTHDSGSIIICKDKSQLNLKEAKLKLQKGLNRRFYAQTREWPYKGVKPRIIAEKYMTDESGIELKDYKIFNFNGKPVLIEVDYNRFISHKRNLYDIKWNFMNVSIEYSNDPKFQIEKPSCLDKMLCLAEKLSAGIPHVRSDFYVIGNNIYFGELTFYHGTGTEQFSPEIFDLELGEYIILPQVTANV